MGESCFADVFLPILNADGIPVEGGSVAERQHNIAAEGSARGRRCHYCGSPATTKDHIVARTWVRRLHVPQWVYQANLVPSCYDCNQRKAWYRSDCDCLICLAAWAMLGPLDVDVPVVAVVAPQTSAA